METTKPHYDVVFATPGKMFHAEYVRSLIETTKWLNEQGLTYHFIGKAGSFIPTTRELSALDAYSDNWDTKEIGAGKFTYGKVFWIDSDIEWDVEAFKAVLESELEIVGGLYQIHPNGRVAVAFKDSEGFPTVVKEADFIMLDPEEPIECFGVGFGFVAMKQGVFESCDRPWFKIEHITWPHLAFETNIGEDYSFSINARRNGITTHVMPNVKVKHHKEIVYELR
jgi:hypothetical protein